MGKSYPLFLVRLFLNLLTTKYGVSVSEIERSTKVKTSVLEHNHAWLYENDNNVLRLMGLLDDVGFFKKDELGLIDQLDSSLPMAVDPVVQVCFAEMHNSETLHRMLDCLMRWNAMMPSQHFSLRCKNGSYFLEHEYRNPAEAVRGPQAAFAFICRELQLLFELTPGDLVICFARHGISDEKGFASRVHWPYDCFGSRSYIQFNRPIGAIQNRNFNQVLDQLLSDAAGSMTRELRLPQRLADRVAAILEVHLVQHYSVLDMAGVAGVLGISRSTLHRRLTEEGVAFHDLRNLVVLDHAQRHVSNRNVNLTAAAESLGFSSLSTFSRFYKSMTGESPLLARKRLAY